VAPSEAAEPFRKVFVGDKKVGKKVGPCYYSAIKMIEGGGAHPRELKKKTPQTHLRLTQLFGKNQGKIQGTETPPSWGGKMGNSDNGRGEGGKG